MKPSRIQCPNPKCRVILQIPSKMQGQHVKCAGCGKTFYVPLPMRGTRRKAS